MIQPFDRLELLVALGVDLCNLKGSAVGVGSHQFTENRIGLPFLPKMVERDGLYGQAKMVEIFGTYVVKSTFEISLIEVELRPQPMPIAMTRAKLEQAVNGVLRFVKQPGANATNSQRRSDRWIEGISVPSLLQQVSAFLRLAELIQQASVPRGNVSRPRCQFNSGSNGFFRFGKLPFVT